MGYADPAENMFNPLQTDNYRYYVLKLQALPHKEHIPSPFGKPLDLFSVGE